MLIYHKTNNKIVCTQVIMGSGKSNISHGSYIWDKHKKMVDKLENNGDVFVTGGTFIGAVYEGAFYERANFKKYIND